MKKPDEIFQKIETDKKHVEFLSTGFPKLDRDLDGGFLKREVVILGAFTGVGKSIFAGQIYYHLATLGFSCGYFSLEISNEMIVSRLAGQLSNIKPSRILNGLLTLEEYDDKAKAKANIIMYNDNMSLHDELYMLGEIEKAIRDNKYEFVIVDFIQNILLANNMDEYQRLSFIAVQLQKIAKETNSCIMVLSQLSNKVGSNNSQVLEYKGSGAIAMIADLGFFLERKPPNLDMNNQPIGNQQVILSLRKNRRGISGQIFELEFIHPGGKIIEKTP